MSKSYPDHSDKMANIHSDTLNVLILSVSVPHTRYYKICIIALRFISNSVVYYLTSVKYNYAECMIP